MTSDESPACHEDYEKLTTSSKTDYPLGCSLLSWVENDIVAKSAQVVWLKMLEVLGFGRHFQNQNSLGEE